MPTIERYSKAASVSDANADIRMDQASQNLMVRASKPSLLGRIACRLHDQKASTKARDRATWQDFIGAVKSHYKNDAAIEPLVQELGRQSTRRKPLTAMQVSTSLKSAEQLMRFKNEQVISSVLNERIEPRADQQPGLANTSSDFLRQAMDDVYRDVAGKINNADPEIYKECSASLAKQIVSRLNDLKPGMDEHRLTRARVKEAVKEAARNVVGFRAAVEEQTAATSRYKVDKNLPADARANQLFLETAKEHGLNIDLKRLPQPVLNYLEMLVSRGCSDAYQELRNNDGLKGEVTEAGLEASIKGRFSRLFKSQHLPLIEQINKLDIDPPSKEKLIDYVCHQPIKPLPGADMLGRVLAAKPQLTAFYQTLPQLVSAVEQSRDNPVENQMAKTKLHTELLKHGSMLSGLYGEMIAACQDPVEAASDPEARDALYDATSDVASLLFLNDEEKEHLNLAYAKPAVREALSDLMSAKDVASHMANTPGSQEQAKSANEMVKSLYPVFLTLDRDVAMSPYNEDNPDVSSSAPAESFSELDNGIITALLEAGFQLPSLDRADRSGAVAIPSEVRADMEKNLQSHLKFGSKELEYNESGLAKSFIADFGRAQFTLTTADGQAINIPRKLSGSFQERSKVILPMFRSFCHQHQRDALMKKNPGVEPSMKKVQRLAENELKLISQIANANLWFDFENRLSTGDLPYNNALLASSTLGTNYHIVAEPDGGFRCEAALAKKGGMLAAHSPQGSAAEEETLLLDPEEAYIKTKLSVAAKPEDFANGSKSASVPRLSGPVGYEYNFKLASDS